MIGFRLFGIAHVCCFYKIFIRDCFRVVSIHFINTISFISCISIINTHDDNTIDYRETFRVLYLNQCNQVLGIKTISTGGVTNSLVDVRTILQGALLANAVAMTLGHNHPSGNVKPSREDERITDQISKAAQLLNIRVLDHIVYTRENHFSFSDQGRL